MIREVLVIFKTHLDIGFTDYAETVTRRYVEQFIPNAVKVGNALRGTETPFVWTVGSWLIREALKKDDGSLDRAIRDGVIRWHGLPFTTHTELMSPALFSYGLSLSKELDERYGVTTAAAKMTDVPGHTIGMVPLLARAGIRFLHIGVNPATPLPAVPPLFRWKAGADSVVVMYQDDYGRVQELDDFALVFAHTGDNMGPQDPAEIVRVYDELRTQYPGAHIYAGTLDDLWAHLRGRTDLPVVTDEIGDSWIHGAGTDPKKVSKFRTLMRRIDETGIGDADLSDSLLVVPEHTWGMDIKKYFPDTEHFLEPDAPAVSEMKRCVERSWAEQRAYVGKAERVLGVKAAYDTTPPDLSGYEEAEKEPAAVSLSWQLFDNEDYRRYKEKYIRSAERWADWDFTKVGLPDYQGGIFEAAVERVYKNKTGKVTCMAFPAELTRRYGLPALYVTEEGEQITVKWVSKAPSRLPQAYWLKFNGAAEPFSLNKMGCWIRPERIIGSPLITAVYDGIRNDRVQIRTLDAPLVAPFGRHLLDWNLPTDKQDLYICLYNNIWNTNFPMWYGEDAVFRFEVKPRTAAEK